MIYLDDIARRQDKIGALASLWNACFAGRALPTSSALTEAFRAAGFSSYLRLTLRDGDLLYTDVGKDAESLFPASVAGASMLARMQPTDRAAAADLFPGCHAHPCGVWADYAAHWGEARHRIKLEALGLPANGDDGRDFFISIQPRSRPPESDPESGIHLVTRIAFSMIDLGAGVPS